MVLILLRLKKHHVQLSRYLAGLIAQLLNLVISVKADLLELVQLLLVLQIHPIEVKAELLQSTL